MAFSRANGNSRLGARRSRYPPGLSTRIISSRDSFGLGKCSSAKTETTYKKAPELKGSLSDDASIKETSLKRALACGRMKKHQRRYKQLTRARYQNTATSTSELNLFLRVTSGNPATTLRKKIYLPHSDWPYRNIFSS